MKQEPIGTQSTLKVIKPSDQSDDITLKKEIQPVGYFRMFRFADTKDKILMICGTIAAIGVGIAMPAFSLLWGNMTNSFENSASDPDEMVRTSKGIMFNFLEIGAGVFFACWIMTACWIIAGERQAIRCRKIYLDALLKQEIGWFDRIDQTQLSSKFSTQTHSFHGAIGEKVGTFVKVISTLVAGFVIAYIKGWQMALVVTAGIPAIGLAGFLYVTILQGKDKKTTANYSEAGGKAEEVIGSIKTVKSLNGESFEATNFQLKLSSAIAKSFKYAIFSGVGMGCVAFAMLSCYALGFWYGSKLVHDKVHNMGSPYTAGDVLVVFFSIVMGGFQLSQMGPCLKKFAQGQSAAAHIYAVLDRTPKIIRDPNGKRIDNLQGIIKFQNVVFAYPKQPDRKILQELSFEIKPNQTTAFVGESGCGKSTVMQLLMRFYDPLGGRITIDGIDLRQLDLQWLRQNIGYVGQEPVLFATTIKQNLLFGNPKATDEQIIDALKKAEAYKFVMDLDKKLETYVGYGGGQLSGGQKQRIAIARAILKNPKILLLDQATSALDRKNQKLIQNTLNKIATGRTTISIAHRTKTIMTADNIIVIQRGEVKQSGAFRQLERFKDYEGEEEKNVEEQLEDKEEGGDPQNPENKKQNINQSPESKQIRKRKISMSKSQIEEMEKKAQRKELVKKYGDSVFKRMLGYTLPDIHLFVLGIIGAIGNGVIFPIFSIYLASMIGVLIEMQIGKGDQSESNRIALIFFGLAIANFFAISIQNTLFAVIADRLTEKIRIQVFNKMIRMPGSWFDNPKNNAGTLSARLSIDCKTINGVTSSYIGIMTQNISCLTCGIIIAFVHEWRITLVTLGLIPVMIACGVIKMKALVGFSQQAGEAYKDSSNLIMEAMINIRTVTSFGVENTIAAKYADLLKPPFKLAVKTGTLSGFLYGASQLVMFVIFALIFYIGTLFVRKFSLDFVDVFTAIYALIFSSMTAGRNSEMMPDLAECKTSGAYLFTILDGEDEDQAQIRQKSPMLTEGGTKGEFQIKNITFKYPTRKFNTFQNLSLKVEAGNKVALVGPSGCGKSTIIQMLLRFYDPDDGEILLDGVNLKNYDVHYLRGLYGLVSQQPVLFNASYAQNIKYNKTDATIQDIRAAAIKANALSFIQSGDNTEGFNRGVGVKGSQISGGQKQRVAIARAILRNPKILLLDQATSALDSTNEKLVQDSLDNIMVNKTSVTVAHRIETIKNSDCIYVFSGGAIVESGTYKDLAAKKGHFYDLEQGNYK